MKRGTKKGKMKKNDRKKNKTELCLAADNNNKKGNKTKVIVLKIITGSLAGFINGMFGGGGGMTVVPCLIYLLGYKTNVAHATTIAIILPLSILSGILYTAFGSLQVVPAISTAAGVTVGGIIGAFLLKKANAKPLTVVFSLLMMAAGIKMLFF